MPDKIFFEGIDPIEAIYTVSATLRRIDERLIDHGERVAYIARKICEKGNLNLDKKTLFILCLFHDIGAYKTEEIDKMLEFETNNVQAHSIYGYLFLKYMTPLNDSAQAILYHHSSWETIKKSDTKYGDYAEIIHLADRIDVALVYKKKTDDIIKILGKSKKIFREEYFEIAQECIKDGSMLTQLENGSFHEDNLEECSTFITSVQEAIEYLKMIVYSIDFRSEHTVTHTINTVAIAVNIARHFNVTEEDIQKIYIGALLHDIGKISIPLSILDYPGRLSDEDMVIMRTHVNETESLIRGVIPDEICEIAIRHHEKLDGSGYPYGLSDKDLTFPERIVAVADIVSALGSRRSYKEPFPKEKTIAIIGQMQEKQLDKKICEYVVNNYNEIMNKTDESRIHVINQYQYIMDEYERINKIL